MSDLQVPSYLKKVPPSLDTEDDRVVHDADHGDREALQEHDGKGRRWTLKVHLNLDNL